MQAPTLDASRRAAVSDEDPPAVARADAAFLEPQDRLDLERVLLWLRLAFLLSAALPLITYGATALPYASLIATCVLCTYAGIATLLWRFPTTLLRWQLGLRLLDCALLWIVLTSYHRFIGDAYYDAVYVFFVVAAAATHGRRGALLVAAAAAAAVGLSRLDLVASGVLRPEVRHLTDGLFYVLFFAITGVAVASLMWKSADVVQRRELVWRRTLAHRNAALEKTAAQLAAANQELEAFSYSVSHDLRAPLRSVDGFSQALLEDYGERLDPEGQAMLRRVRAAGQRMGQLIDDLLTLSRITRSELRLDTVDLSALAAVIVAELRLAHPERQVEVAVEPGLVAVADVHLIQVALDNLLDNAWKFTSRQPQAHIAFGACEHDGERVYFVRDNGAGFDMAYVHKLFGAFQRLHPVAEFEGTGVGLATVQRIVHRHGGRIWAESPGRGQGATFYFTL